MGIPHGLVFPTWYMYICRLIRGWTLYLAALAQFMSCESFLFACFLDGRDFPGKALKEAAQTGRKRQHQFTQAVALWSPNCMWHIWKIPFLPNMKLHLPSPQLISNKNKCGVKRKGRACQNRPTWKLLVALLLKLSNYQHYLLFSPGIHFCETWNKDYYFNWQHAHILTHIEIL